MTVTKTRQVRGLTVPAFMYGTAWKQERTEGCVSDAIAAGFRAIDTANQRRHYYEAGVGAAIAAAAVSRDELFLQTKFTYRPGQDHRLPYDPNASFTDQVAQSFKSSLEHLGVEHLDSYVLHGPSVRAGLSDADWETWRAMEALQRAGKTRLLGVSNVGLDQLQRLSADAEVQPAFVQNRCFARAGWDRAVRAFCAAHDIVYQGFSLLTANDRELRTRAVFDMADRTGRTIPQLVFRFALQVGMLPLTGTTSTAHMAEDLDVFDFELSSADVKTIETVAG